MEMLYWQKKVCHEELKNYAKSMCLDGLCCSSVCSLLLLLLLALYSDQLNHCPTVVFFC